MATEENKEAEAQAEAEEKKSAIKNIVHIVEDENSYINSAKERMNDVIDTFLTNAENSVALNDFSLIFKWLFVTFGVVLTFIPHCHSYTSYVAKELGHIVQITPCLIKK